MFVSTHHHKRETDRLNAELKDRDERIAALERRVVEAERTRHEFIEEIRYVIEASGDHVISNDPLRGEHLRTVGHMLPYLLSGRRHWSGPELQGVTDSAVLSAKHRGRRPHERSSPRGLHREDAPHAFPAVRQHPGRLEELASGLERGLYVEETQRRLDMDCGRHRLRPVLRVGALARALWGALELHDGPTLGRLEQHLGLYRGFRRVPSIHRAVRWRNGRWTSRVGRQRWQKSSKNRSMGTVTRSGVAAQGACLPRPM